jgi:hypothetical protein
VRGITSVDNRNDSAKYKKIIWKNIVEKGECGKILFLSSHPVSKDSAFDVYFVLFDNFNFRIKFFSKDNIPSYALEVINLSWMLDFYFKIF